MVIRCNSKRTFTSPQLELNPLDLANRDLIFGPIVKLGGPGRLMRSHLLGRLEPASILQVNRHAGRAPGVTPDRRQKPRVPRSFVKSPSTGFNSWTQLHLNRRLAGKRV